MVDLLGCSDVHRRGEGVIARLSAVDVVVGMHRGLASNRTAGNLDCPVGYHLVRVHVGLGARSRLPDPQGEMPV